jgi:hypothetical protein
MVEVGSTVSAGLVGDARVIVAVEGSCVDSSAGVMLDSTSSDKSGAGSCWQAINVLVIVTNRIKREKMALKLMTPPFDATIALIRRRYPASQPKNKC